MANQTYELPQNLGDLMGAYDQAHWQTQVSEIKAGIGVLQRGTILASGTGADIGKLVKLTATTEVNAYGVLLDPSIDTAAPFTDGTVTGSIAKAGSFKGSALIVPAGVDAGLISVALRGRGIFVEGPITVPAAAAAEPEAKEPDRSRQQGEQEAPAAEAGEPKAPPPVIFRS